MRLWICCWLALVFVSCVLLGLANYLGVVEIDLDNAQVKISGSMLPPIPWGGDPELQQSIFWIYTSLWLILGMVLFANAILGLLLARLIAGSRATSSDAPAAVALHQVPGSGGEDVES